MSYYSYLIMEYDVISKVIWNVDLNFRTSLRVSIQDGLGLFGKLQAVVEEDGAHEWKRFELVEGYRMFQQLPLRIAGAEFLDEFIRIS